MLPGELTLASLSGGKTLQKKKNTGNGFIPKGQSQGDTWRKDDNDGKGRLKIPILRASENSREHIQCGKVLEQPLLKSVRNGAAVATSIPGIQNAKKLSKLEANQKSLISNKLSIYAEAVSEADFSTVLNSVFYPSQASTPRLNCCFSLREAGLKLSLHLTA